MNEKLKIELEEIDDLTSKVDEITKFDIFKYQKNMTCTQKLRKDKKKY